MRKLFKCRKALSPVVAAIILIAVTVAVSIAVAAWMGALTFTFMKTEELKITRIQFLGTTSKSINLTIMNPGTSKVTVSTIKINDVTVTATITDYPATSTPLEWSAGNTHTIAFSYTWVSGNKYKVTLLSATGTPVGAYEDTA
jgi:flagellin-like protein